MRTLALEEIRQDLGKAIWSHLERDGFQTVVINFPWEHPQPDDQDQGSTVISVSIIADPNLELPNMCYSIQVTYRRPSRQQAYEQSTAFLMAMREAAILLSEERAAILPEIRFMAFDQRVMPSSVGGDWWTCMTVLVRWRWRSEGKAATP